MKILVFGASNSKHSINKRLASYASSLVKNAEIELIDLNDFELPLYGQDREIELGIPDSVKLFCKKVAEADALIISFAEHNGSYTVAYKNIFDWASRVVKKVYENKKIVALATSPGPGGAKSVLTSALVSLPFFGATVVGSLSVPSFNENFKDDKLINTELNQQLIKILEEL